MPRELAILFLCTGNSCRSQMAEGLGKKHLPAGTVVLSAGTEPKPVNPLAVAAMAEVGIDISQQASKDLGAVSGAVDLVITLCDHAAQSCPQGAFPDAKREHWPIEDPALATGTPEEVRAAFRKARDEIERRVKEQARFLFGQTFRAQRFSPGSGA